MNIITSPMLAASVVLLFASPGVAQSDRPTRAEQAHSSKAADTLRSHVERAEGIVNELLAKHQAGSTARQQNTLIAVHESDLKKLQAELQAMSSSTPASESPSVASRGTLADHVREAKRLTDVLSHVRPAEPVGTTGAQSGSSGTTPPASSVSGHDTPAAHEDIVTIDRTRVQELKRQIEAIERLEPKSK